MNGWTKEDIETFIDEMVRGIECATLGGVSDEAAEKHRQQAIRQLKGMLSIESS